MDAVNDPDSASRTGGGSSSRSRVASAIEQGILASRYVLVPLYLGLTLSLVLLCVKFAQKLLFLMTDSLQGEITSLITGVLMLIDLTLLGNLIIIVTFAGYENFIARLPASMSGNRPDWMGQVSFAATKLKLITSIIAITAIHLLEDFMHVDQVSDREMAWSIGTLFTFIVTGAVLVAIDRLSDNEHSRDV